MVYLSVISMFEGALVWSTCLVYLCLRELWYGLLIWYIYVSGSSGMVSLSGIYVSERSGLVLKGALVWSMYLSGMSMFQGALVWLTCLVYMFQRALVWYTCLIYLCLRELWYGLLVWYIYVSGSSGMAYLSGMCSTEASCTIAEARSLGSTALISKLGSRNC